MKRQSLSRELREYVRRRDNWTCWRCGEVEREEVRVPPAYRPSSFGGLPSFLFVFDVDHLIPASHGGPDRPWNLALACGRCNRGRQAKLEPAALELAQTQFERWWWD